MRSALAVDRMPLVFGSSIGRSGWMTVPTPCGALVVWVATLGGVVLVGTLPGPPAGGGHRDGHPCRLGSGPVGPDPLPKLARRGSGPGRDFWGLAVGASIVAGAAAHERFGE